MRRGRSSSANHLPMGFLTGAVFVTVSAFAWMGWNVYEDRRITVSTLERGLPIAKLVVVSVGIPLLLAGWMVVLRAIRRRQTALRASNERLASQAEELSSEIADRQRVEQELLRKNRELQRLNARLDSSAGELSALMKGVTEGRITTARFGSCVPARCREVNNCESEECPAHGNSESELGETFNEMMAILEERQEALVKALQAAEDATRTKSLFLANISHEIRTPMTAILGFADILLEDGDLGRAPPERLNAAETIKRNGVYLLNIVDDLLDLSKIEAGKMTIERIACSPCRIVAEVASLTRVGAEVRGVAFNIEYIGVIPESIQTDPTRLRQILVNLIGNAIKFTGGGSIRLITRLVDEGDRPIVQFDIVDTGIGMTEEQIASLFQPFTQADAATTRKFGGTGIGLNLSRHLARMLGGDVAIVESKPGVGTRFRAIIPTGRIDGVKMIEDPLLATIVTPAATEAIAPIEEGLPRGYRVLLAEDGPDNQRLVSLMLKKAGAEVHIAENGRIAVDRALAALEQGSPFDIILMDIQMPVLDGYAATKLLRAKGYAGPIVALTAYAMPDDRAKSREAGCDDHVAKPVTRKKLIEAIRSNLVRDASAGTGGTLSLASAAR